MASKRLYEAIAAKIRDVKVESQTEKERLAEAVADALKEDNPRFDRGRFLDAACDFEIGG